MMTPAAVRGALFVAALTAAPVLATTAGDLCGPAADPCAVDSAVHVDAGSVIDLGPRALHVGPGGSLTVGSGLMTIRCGSLLIRPGGVLSARAKTGGGSITVIATGDITVAASDTVRGVIDVSDAADPGTVTLTASGDVAIDGLLSADATSTEGDGGLVALSAGDGIAVSGRIGVAGGADGGGGGASLDANHDVAMDGSVDASGGETDGGSVDVKADGSLTLGPDDTLDVSGGGMSGGGGDVTLLARGAALTIGGAVLARAGGSAEEGGGDGGSFAASAPAGVVHLDGKVLVPGAAPDGGGGDAELDAGLALSVSGALSASGADEGGLVTLTAPTLTISGDVDTSGGGSGGNAVLAACTMQVPAGARIASEGPGGSNLLQATGPMTIAGTLASGAPGTNELDYADPSSPPVLAGAAIDPPPKIVLKTPLRVSCAIAACGNGVVDPGEQCDDGAANGAPGERCSAVCRLATAGSGPLCGNGTVDPGEQCDDGGRNGAPGDRCSAQCGELPPTMDPAGPGRDACGLGWTVDGAPAAVARRAHATQRCADGDPACDFDSAAGTCRFHVWACADAGSPDSECPESPLTRVRLRGGRGVKQSAAGADRRSLQAALGALPLPLASGRACTSRIDVNVARGRPLILRTAAHTSRGRVLRDVLRLRCIGGPPAATASAVEAGGR